MKRFTLPVACLAFAAVAGSANAVIIAPGGAAFLPGLADVNGVMVAFESVNVTGVNAASETRFTGVLTAEVFQEASGTLDFWYQYQNDANSLDSVDRLTMTNFAGFVTDVDYLSPQNDPIAPTYGDRSNDGGTVGFQFVQPPFPNANGVILPGEGSDWLEIETNAHTFTLGTTSVIDGAVGTVVTFAPSPEPATMLALGVGVAGLIRRRKLAKK